MKVEMYCRGRKYLEGEQNSFEKIEKRQRRRSGDRKRLTLAPKIERSYRERCIFTDRFPSASQKESARILRFYRIDPTNGYEMFLNNMLSQYTGDPSLS